MNTIDPLNALIELEKEGKDFGFYWPTVETILEQITSECAEIKEAISLQESKQRIAEEIGDLFHALVCLCYFQGYDPEQICRKSVAKYQQRFSTLKKITKARGLSNLKGQSHKLKLEIWDEVKKQETTMDSC